MENIVLVGPHEYEDLTKRARLNDLQAERINTLERDNLGLKSEIKTLQENQDILFDLFSKLRIEKELQPKQQDRSEILLALLRDNQGKMFAKEARRKMGLGKATFSVLLKSLESEIDKKPYHLKKNQLVISLK